MTTCDFDNSFFIFKDFIYTNVTYLSCYLQQTNLEPIFLQGDMKVCYCESPLPSQVLNKAKSLAPIETKLAAQMAEKLGSFLWSVDIPLKGLMECLLTTVWHPKARARNGFADVASTTPTFTRTLESTQRLTCQTWPQFFIPELWAIFGGSKVLSKGYSHLITGTQFVQISNVLSGIWMSSFRIPTVFYLFICVIKVSVKCVRVIIFIHVKLG